MFKEAVVVDAGMTVTGALRRLAQYGYWSEPQGLGPRSWIEEHLAATYKVASQEAPPRGNRDPDDRSSAGHPPPDYESTMPTIADATRLLARPSTDVRVVIRRQDGVTVYWYARNLVEVLEILAEAGADDTVALALHLHKFSSSPIAQLADLDTKSVEKFTGVILRGQEPIGVCESNGRALRSDGWSQVDQESFDDAWLERSADAHSVEHGDATGHEEPVIEAKEEGGRELRPYPFMHAPSHVTVGCVFKVEIGLSDSPSSEVVSSGPLALRARAGEESIEIGLEIIADGFQAPDGWRQTLTVDVNSPTNARVAVPLIALPQSESVRLTRLCIHFIVDGVVSGAAAKNIVVTQPGVEAPGPDIRGQSWLNSEETFTALSLAPVAARPDMELDIVKPDGNPVTGSYRCVIRNSHGIEVPDRPLPVELGDDARTFAKKLIDDVRLYSDSRLIDRFLENTGAMISEKLPREFWEVVQAIAEKVKDRPITLQVNSAEPYVPWELAIVDPPIDPARPKFLGAQLVMGRWIIGAEGVKSPPREALPIRAMAVMAGMYNASTGLRALPQAEAEAKALTESYAALPVIPLECTTTQLIELLDAILSFKLEVIGGVEIVHFAGHGEVDPSRAGDAAIYLSDGKPISPIFFLRSKLGQVYSPFIFLNACMVGTGGQFLGDYGGFPGNCLAGGFSGLVAPLWAVNDKIAKSVAIEFYRQVFAGPTGRSVAEILRDIRAVYNSAEPVASYLAYVYYGNPSLKLTRLGGIAVAAEQ